MSNDQVFIGVNVPPAMKADISRIAVARYTNLSSLVRQALADYVERVKEERPEIWDGERKEQ